MYRRQGARPSPKKKCKKAKWLSEKALQIAVKRREAKSKGEKERYTHLKAEFQRKAMRDKKAFLRDQCKEQRIQIEWERLEISSKKLEIPREIFFFFFGYQITLFEGMVLQGKFLMQTWAQ